MITMTIDHVGVFLDFNNFYLLRIIGRLALPLFVFLSVQGALKTSNKKKYILRMSIYSVLIGIVLGIFAFSSNSTLKEVGLAGNIFLDLLLVILSVFILESKNSKIKPLIVLPILFSIFSYIVLRFEGCGCDGIYYWMFPPLRLQYSLFSLLLGLGFYYAHKLSPILISKYAPSQSEDNDYIQSISNILSLFFMIVVSVLLFVINSLWGASYVQILDGIMTYSVLAGIIILFYNGKRGYNAKWFKVAYYLYYPIHICIISLIFMLIGV